METVPHVMSPEPDATDSASSPSEGDNSDDGECVSSCSVITSWYNSQGNSFLQTVRASKLEEW